MSGNHENIFHRSLDLLHFWITDCKMVDFTPMSSLVSTLENFLNTEVTTRAGCTSCMFYGWKLNYFHCRV